MATNGDDDDDDDDPDLHLHSTIFEEHDHDFLLFLNTSPDEERLIFRHVHIFEFIHAPVLHHDLSAHLSMTCGLSKNLM